MPKPRSHLRRDLPDNLYERAGYYSWRNPETGRELGIGRDRTDAIKQAKEANRFIAEKTTGKLVDRLAEETRSIAAFAPRYREKLETLKLAPLTRYHRKRYLKHIEHDLGHVVIGARQEDTTEITRQVADYLREIEKSGRQRTAQGFRTALLEMFSEMGAAGWISVNPIEIIQVSAPTVKRARLTLDDFMSIYKAAGKLYPWVQRSFELGLVTLQRREDIAVMQFRQQEDGRLKVEQQKSVDAEDGAPQMRLRIPLELRLHAVNWGLAEIMGRCRDNVVSRYLVHHDRSQGQASAGDPVHPQTITGAFREARELAGINVPDGKTPPTYHELRSLGIRLYKKQGYNPQDLAGHKREETTALYTDSRGAEWIDVAA